MEENLDNKFGQKIKDVFENRHEPYNPEDWEKLKAKRSKDKDRYLFWYFNKSAAIAIIFLILGGAGGFILYDTLQDKSLPIDNKNELIIVEVESVKNDSISKQDSLKKPTRNTYEKNIENLINESENNITVIDDNKGKINNKIGNNSNLILQTSENLDKTIEKKKINENNSVVFNQPDKKQDSNSIPKNLNLEKDDINGRIKESKISIADNSELKQPIKDLQNKDMKEVNQNIIEQEKLIVDINKPIPLDSTSKKDINLVLEELNEKESKKNTITFGLAVSPNINYDQTNQKTNINVGGGVLLEISILKRFDLYTGILIANQKINIQENTLEIIASGTQLKSKEISLTGLDIPINLKYNFSLNKSNMFISAGFSSVAYLKENVSSTYQVSSTVQVESTNEFGDEILVSKIINTLETETESKGSFNNFYFGKIVNFSFGIEFPFENNRQSLIIEPYFKYPLGSVNSESVNFSNGGVILKLNFNGKKTK